MFVFFFLWFKSRDALDCGGRQQKPLKPQSWDFYHGCHSVSRGVFSLALVVVVCTWWHRKLVGTVSKPAGNLRNGIASVSEYSDNTRQVCPFVVPRPRCTLYSRSIYCGTLPVMFCFFQMHSVSKSTCICRTVIHTSRSVLYKNQGFKCIYLQLVNGLCTWSLLKIRWDQQLYPWNQHP
jgi:hypothetical protein